MRHADHDFVHVVAGARARAISSRIGEGGFAAFQREALLADEAGVQEMLELFGRRSGCAECAGAVSRSSGQLLASGSMRCCSQRFCSGTWMFMYSQPILPQ